MGDLLSLAARVEKLTGPSKEVDRAVARVVGWFRVEPRHSRNRYGGWIAPDDFIGAYRDGSPMLDGLHGTTIWRDPPSWTASVDAVLALIERDLPGTRLMMSAGDDFSSAMITAGWGARKRILCPQIERPDNHVAICAVAAFLRAKAAQQVEADR